MIAEIRERILEAAHENRKMAMFHYQVLLNSAELLNYDPAEFCTAVGVPESYATEFRKMLSLAAVMRDSNSRIVEA
ncbi:MAG: transcription factor [Gammaproteobacteria bacterium]|jgi:hypothetical protein|nr:transcription factor [Gammaproteobacteria bacterium]MBQ0774518.1 transcription factor [Gammaproteobacteria bacterium]|tara:strand:- start:26564 stop:26791 length:228 start_codon:yes stop_codon:yes gene_type:complete